ncbi:hypothetical protein ABZV78_01525 [Micromonospora sp. NPDC004540]
MDLLVPLGQMLRHHGILPQRRPGFFTAWFTALTWSDVSGVSRRGW